MDTIIDRQKIKWMKEFYQYTVVKEVKLDDIKHACGMCINARGDIFISCMQTKNIMVFNSELEEIRCFKVDIRPINIAVLNEYLLISDWREAKVCLYSTDGVRAWTKDADEVRGGLRKPCVGNYDDATVGLTDIESNTIFNVSLVGDRVNLQSSCCVVGQSFYVPSAKAWPLRGLCSDGTKYYVIHQGAIHSINEQGELRRLDIAMPLIPAAKSMHVQNGHFYICAGAPSNSIFCIALDGSIKAVEIDIKDGEIIRAARFKEFLYAMKEKTAVGEVIISKVSF